MELAHEVVCENEGYEPREQDRVVDRKRDKQKAAQKIGIHDELQWAANA